VNPTLISNVQWSHWMSRYSLMLWCLSTIATLPSASWAIESAAKTDRSPRIAGYERYHGQTLGDAADEEEDRQPVDELALGRLLVGELNCVACHATSHELKQVLLSKQAPRLTNVSQRVQPEWILEYLADPHQAKPGTTMPHILGALPENERASAALALTHFLASDKALRNSFVDRGLANKGANTFQRVGCAACHNLAKDGAEDWKTSVSLSHVSQKYTVESLTRFLKEPHEARPSARMPSLNLKDEEIREIVAWFFRDLTFPPNLTYAYYEGSWENLPNFSELKSVSSGETSGFDVEIAPKKSDYGLVFTGTIDVPAAGEYQFWITSDDGSELKIDGASVAKMDGIHPAQTKAGKTRLEAGKHPVVVEFFQQGGGAELKVEVQGPKLSRRPLESLLVALPSKASAGQELAKRPFEFDPNLAAQGKELFTSLNCAACHEYKQGNDTLKPQHQATELAKIDLTKGCLAESVSGKSANYRLSEAQRSSIQQALKALKDVASQPEALAALTSGPAKIHQTFLAFNCYACHQRGLYGGAEKIRDSVFETTMKEMGDEGRLPPSLNGVGDKLRDDWLAKLLNEGANNRQNYMLTHMPRYGSGAIGHLKDLLIAADRKPEPAPDTIVKFSEPDYRIKAAGRHMVGGNSLSCIKCHDFGQYPSIGIRAINLASMTSRLREDWFVRYLANPQEYRPGTRMPAAWPFGTTSLPDLLEGKPELQIRAVWMYLSDGEKAAIPAGLIREPIELVATDAPLVYRNFIEGAGSRGIGIAFPEKVNLAWDANNMRLAMIWHGAFIDASRHWTGRGQGFTGPSGDEILAMPDGRPVAYLTTPDQAWPEGLARENGYRFQGYSLPVVAKDQPALTAFQFTDGRLDVIDQFSAWKSSPNDTTTDLQRTILTRPYKGSTISSTDGTPQFRVLKASRIEQEESLAGNSSSSTTWLIDGVWRLTIEPQAGTQGLRPQLRTMGNSNELLLPLHPDKATGWVLKFNW
jgi:cytochrome c2